MVGDTEKDGSLEWEYAGNNELSRKIFLAEMGYKLGQNES